MSVRKTKQSMSKVELLRLLAELPPPTGDEIQWFRKILRSETREVANAQIARAMPEGSASSDSHPLWQAAALLGTFLPDDGPDSALSRLMIAATNAAMDCFARANSDSSEVRDLELNYAVKLSLVAATLGKAFDQHRASKKEDFIDHTQPSQPRPKNPTKASPQAAQARTPDEKANPSTKATG